MSALAALTGMDVCAAPLIVGGRMDVVSIPDSEFVELLGIELPRVQRIARLLIGNADVADDVVAEAVARTLPRWRAGGIDDYSAYLRRVVVNLAAQRWHRRALALRRDHFALDWLSRPTDVETTVAERDRMLGAVMRLPVRRRAVVVLRFYDDMTEARIAQVLGITVGTVKSQLSRALEQLRTDFETLEQV